MNWYVNSASSCHRPGTPALGLTAITMSAVAQITVSNMKAEEFVNDASMSPILIGIQVCITN